MRYNKTHLRKTQIRGAVCLPASGSHYRIPLLQLCYALESTGNSLLQRPPSVDAFLPIAGLMSFKYFLLTGIIEPVHPAAFVMFVAIVAVSILLKKGFCGWICPVGTVSQYFWMAGEKIFGKNYQDEKIC